MSFNLMGVKAPGGNFMVRAFIIGDDNRLAYEFNVSFYFNDYENKKVKVWQIPGAEAIELPCESITCYGNENGNITLRLTMTEDQIKRRFQGR